MLTQFGQYYLDEPLATGGMARLYRAHLRGLGGFEKPLVVKQVLPELARDPRFVEMFVREANTLVQMNHPHIVSVYELGVVEGIYFLAMEYVEGATIASILRDGPLSAISVAQVGVQVCDALEYAHGRFGILHRDLSPRNIIVDGAGHARLLDFGVSTHIDSADQTGFGSPGYVAPEQVRGESSSFRSDLFAFGAVMFEALEGRPAFLREDRVATKRALLEEPSPRLDPARHPEALVRWVGRLLEEDPAGRPASAQEVGRALRGWLSQHAPEGAFEGLVARVAQARARRVQPSSGTTSSVPPAGEVATRARTLATSPLLVEARRRSEPKRLPVSSQVSPASVVGTGTRPITGRPPFPARVPGDRTRPITGRKPAPAAEGADAASAPVGGEGDASQQAERPVRHRSWLWAGAIAAGAILAALVLPRVDSTDSAASGGPQEGERGATPSAAPAAPAGSPAERPGPRPSGPDPSPPPPAEPPPAPSGMLYVNALPWAEVRVDGRALGTTPLRSVRLDAGKHSLSVHCPPLDRRATVPLTIQQGGTTRVIVDLQTKPPEVQVR